MNTAPISLTQFVEKVIISLKSKVNNVVGTLKRQQALKKLRLNSSGRTPKSAESGPRRAECQCLCPNCPSEPEALRAFRLLVAPYSRKRVCQGRRSRRRETLTRSFDCCTSATTGFDAAQNNPPPVAGELLISWSSGTADRGASGCRTCRSFCSWSWCSRRGPWVWRLRRPSASSWSRRSPSSRST